MNTFQELNTLLPAVLDLASIGDHEYLIVSGAAEYLAGLGNRFGDVDIIIGPHTFNRLLKDMFQFEMKDFAGKPCRVIRVGLVDIIECEELSWFLAPRNKNITYPILDNEHLIKWRIAIGRDKDQLRAWQMIHQLSPRPSLPDEKVSEVKSFNQMLTGFTHTLMEMA